MLFMAISTGSSVKQRTDSKDVRFEPLDEAQRDELSAEVTQLIKMADALLKEDDDGQKDRILPQE